MSYTSFLKQYSDTSCSNKKKSASTKILIVRFKISKIDLLVLQEQFPSDKIPNGPL